MFIIRVKKQAILIFGIFLVFGFSSILFLSREICNAEENKNFIKYAEFNPTYEALNKAIATLTQVIDPLAKFFKVFG